MKHNHVNACVTKYLAQHPIFDYFAGIPLVISIVAPLSVYKSLSEIFIYLADKRQREGDHFDEQLNEGSLVDCLEYCTGHFQKLQE